VTVLAAGSAVDAPGTLSFLVIFGMAVVLFFLFRSMSKHLRKVMGRPARDGRAEAAAASDKPGPAGPGSGGEAGPGQPG